MMATAVLLLAGSGCGEKKGTTNEKVTRANADRIKVDKTTLPEAEQLLGPGENHSEPGLAAGLKAKKWGRGKDGEEIRVVYRPDGLTVQRSFIQWRSGAK